MFGNVSEKINLLPFGSTIFATFFASVVFNPEIFINKLFVITRLSFQCRYNLVVIEFYHTMSSFHMIIVCWHIGKEMITFLAAKHFNTCTNMHSFMHLKINSFSKTINISLKSIELSQIALPWERMHLGISCDKYHKNNPDDSFDGIHNDVRYGILNYNIDTYIYGAAHVRPYDTSAMGIS